MGNVVNVSIQTDYYEWVRKNPERFVDAISSGMNNGTDSYVNKALAGDSYQGARYPTSDETEASRNGVTIHRYSHMDVPQTIFCHQNMPLDVWDLTYGIEKGFLDLVGNPQTHIKIYRNVAKELRRQAKNLDKVLDAHEEKAEEQ